MKTYIILLRGINVGGKNVIKMSDLKILLERNGFLNVRSYIQSGNIVLNHKIDNIKEIQSFVQNLILSEFKLDVPVMVLEESYLITILKNNPFLKSEKYDIKHLYITLIENITSVNNEATLLSINSNEDKVSLGDHCVYLYCPNGYSKTKYTNNLIESKLNCKATTRNLKTLNKILTLI